MRHLLHITYCFLFFICVGMSCEDNFYYPVDIIDFSLTHIDNSGEFPSETLDNNQVRKEAYVLKVELDLRDENNDAILSKDYDYRLKDPIVYIQVLCAEWTEEDLSGFVDVTSSFKSYQIGEFIRKSHINPIPMRSVELVENPSIYMALLDIPEPGTYTYQVNIVLVSGRTISKTTQSIGLY